MLQRHSRFIILFPLLCSSFVDSFVLQPSHQTARAPTELHVKRFFSKLLGRGKYTAHEVDRETIIVSKALTGRRTVNSFETTKVSNEVVQRAVEAAIYAPCHKMTEPWRFILLGDDSISKIAALNAAEISKKDPAKGEKKKKRWEAIPGWCVVTSAKSDGGLQEREDYAATCCAIQNFMLSLWAEGVGTKWTTGPITRTTEFADVCGIDLNEEEVAGCIWYGFPTNKESTPAPKRRKSIEDVISRRP